jgi:hypothetical protein
LPARTNAETERRRAIASAVYRPCLRAFLFPFGAPGDIPPCIRHRPFGIAGDWHDDEAGSRRRMMSVSAHDRISGTPQMVKVWDAFLTYARKRPGVAFLRKDTIARYVLQSPLTLRESETL